MPPPGYNTGSRRASNADIQPTTTKTQRVRGVSFKQEYSRSAPMKRLTRQRAPSMVSEPTKCMLPPQSKEDRGRITVVLDLDETLIYAREGPLYARPGLAELLDFLSRHCEPIVWTAGVKAYAQAVVRNIDKEGAFRHCVYRHKKWFSGCAGYNKDLTLLGRDMSRLIILENTPDCVRGNEENGIVVADYEGTPEEADDPTLFAIKHMLKDMVNKANNGMTVPEYITQSPLLSKMAVPTDLGDRLVVYCLDCTNFADSKESRVNRDLAK
ncbi:CTD small phosphatase-like protein 2 [Diplonema papillatum]|nr:CTD small phosphatase-like protein 2 [Diplonema papillatum]KAJ9465304.1 CTD small phosphatase-like protein 2 [Diplonema papillatum]